jgi:type VI secretion system protein VasG
MNLNLKTLIGKLNDTTRLAATRAASICVALGQYEVEVEHLFLALLEHERCDAALIVRSCGISVDGLESDLHQEVSQFKTGSTRTPVFSRHLPLLLEHAWLIASLATTQPARIRSGHLLVALLTEPELAQLAQRASPLFGRIPIDEVKHKLEKYTHGSQEEAAAVTSATQLADVAQPGGARTPALDQYTTNLTASHARGQGRSRDRPRGGNPPGDRHPDAAPPEQSDPDRRGRRRQDGGGGRAGDAHRHGRRAGSAARAWISGRWTWACCRPVPASRASSRTA